MIIEENVDPDFEAPEGYKLIRPIKLDRDLLANNDLVIRNIEILDDYSIEIVFATHKESIEDMIEDSLDGLEESQIRDISRDEMFDQICADLGEEYFDSIEKIGIPRAAIVSGPDIECNGLGTSLLYTACFLIQPKVSFRLHASLSSLTEVNESMQIAVSRSCLLLSSDSDYDRYRINEGYHLHKLGLDLAWVLPWRMHWTIEYARATHEERSDEEPKIIFSYDFFTGKRRWNGYDDMYRSFPIRLSDYYLRPIIFE